MLYMYMYQTFAWHLHTSGSSIAPPQRRKPQFTWLVKLDEMLSAEFPRCPFIAWRGGLNWGAPRLRAHTCTSRRSGMSQLLLQVAEGHCSHLTFKAAISVIRAFVFSHPDHCGFVGLQWLGQVHMWRNSLTGLMTADISVCL